MIDRFMRWGCGVLCLGFTALPLMGCGPTFFSAKGTIGSSGGTLGNWSVTPVGCHRDDKDGDTSQLVTLSFKNPNANDPDREVHDKTRPPFLAIFHVQKAPGGLAVEGSMSKGNDFSFDSASCKKLEYTAKEGRPDMPGMTPPVDGQLKLDCTVQQSHLVADLQLKHCE